MEDKWILACDETTKDWENEKVFTYAGALIAPDKQYSFKNAWQKLQEEVRDFLLSQNYYGALRDKKLVEGVLPEIHASDMINGKGVSRKFKKRNSPLRAPDTSFIRHRIWIQDALDIAAQHSVKVMISNYRIGKELEETLNIGQNRARDLYHLHAGGKKIKRDQTKLKMISNNPVPLGVTNIYGQGYFHLDILQEKGICLCDRHDLLTGFREIKRILGKYDARRNNTLELPEAVESSDNPFIQLADVCAFVARNDFYRFQTGKPLKPFEEGWLESSAYKQLPLSFDVIDDGVYVLDEPEARTKHFYIPAQELAIANALVAYKVTRSRQYKEPMIEACLMVGQNYMDRIRQEYGDIAEIT